MAGLTVAEAVERIAEELGLGESSARRPKAVASSALEQLALPRVEGEGLKAQLGRILQELDIASGWELSGKHDAVSSDARLCLLAIGGWDCQFQRLRRVDVLEWSATGQPAPAWHSLPPLLAARCGSAACVAADGAVMAVGGIGEKSAELLPRTAAEGWRMLPPMSAERCGARAILLCDGRVAVIGGSRLSGRLLHSSAEAYDPNSDSWSALAPMSVARVNFACSGVGTDGGGAARVIVAGGELSPPAPGASSLAQTGVTDAVEVYEVSINCWSPLPNLSVQRYGGGAASLGESGGLMLVFGGFGGRSAAGEAQKQKQKTGGFTGIPMPAALQAQAGAGNPAENPVQPPPPPPAEGIDAAADWGSVLAEAPTKTLSVATAELAQFVSADVTSLIQPQVAGLPQMFDDGGCMCCSDTPTADSVRGQPLHSTELYDERLGVWTPCQPMLLARQNIGTCTVGMETQGTPRVVALGGMVGGRAVASCEQLQFPSDAGGDESLAMLVGQAEWSTLEPALPEPRSHCAALTAWLVLPPTLETDASPKSEPESEPEPPQAPS